jgi:hypothetical protein
MNQQLPRRRWLSPPAHVAELVELQADYQAWHPVRLCVGALSTNETKPQDDGRGTVRMHETGGLFHYHRARLHP